MRQVSRFNISNEDGFSLLEVTVFSGIMLLMMMGAMAVTTTQNKQIKLMSQKVAINDLNNSVIRVMQNSASCVNNLTMLVNSSITFDSTILAPVPSISLNQIVVGESSSSQALVVVNQEILPGSGIKASAISLKNLKDAGSGKWTGNWQIDLVNESSSFVFKPIQLAVQSFTVDVTTPTAARITGCDSVVISGGALIAGHVAVVSSPYTIVSTQAGTYFSYTNPADGVITLPPVAGLVDGWQVTVLRKVFNQLTITLSGADSFASGATTLEMRSQNLQSVTLTKTGSSWSITNSAADCIVGQSCWGTNHIYFGVFNGKQYFTTPSGCTDSATPTCAGGPETINKEWSTNLGPAWNTIVGQRNKLDGKAQSAMINLYSTALAVKYCEDMTYAGYSDWYLPAIQELVYLYKQTRSITNLNSTGIYWSSTESDVPTEALFFNNIEGRGFAGPKITFGIGIFAV